jgi:hypothetical protein
MGNVTPDNSIISYLRSIEPWLDDAGNHQTIKQIKKELSGDELTDIKADTELAYKSVEISNNKYLLSPDYKFFILPGQHYKIVSELNRHPILKSVGDKMGNRRFATNDSGTRGYLRNI